MLSLSSGFIIGIRSILPLILVLSYLYTALSIVRVIVMEKEKRLKEALKMIGMKNWVRFVLTLALALLYY